MILLQKAQIFDIRSKHHLKKMDVLVDKGIITRIARNIIPSSKMKVIKSPALSISPGWLDIGTYNGEPGNEYREDLNSLCSASANAGYCGLAPFPSGLPTIDSRGQLMYLKSLTDSQPVDLYPVAAFTKSRKGEELSELLDLHHGGAVAFSDGTEDFLDDAQLLRGMIYLRSVGGITIYNAFKKSFGDLHEGPISVQMGMEGSPAVMEESNIHNAISQSEYAASDLLIHNISTTSCLKEIKASSNREKLALSVALMNLIFEDSDVLQFDLNLKTFPPLRDNIKTLSRAVENGQINVITSNHTPLSIEEKDQPFGLSAPGASTIDTVFPALNALTNGISLERLIHCLSVGPHEALKINCPIIEKGVKARLTVFDPDKDVIFYETDLRSKSKNNPFLEKRLKGHVLGIINERKSTV